MWVREPLTAVITTEYAPDVAELTVSLEVPDPVRVPELSATDSPAGLLVDRLTVPLKPSSAVTVIVEEPETPAVRPRVAGLADMV